MRIEKYKNKSIAEPQEDIQDKQNKLYIYQLDLKSGKEKDTSKVNLMKKDIARIMTIMTQRRTLDEVVVAVNKVDDVKESVAEILTKGESK